MSQTDYDHYPAPTRPSLVPTIQLGRDRVEMNRDLLKKALAEVHEQEETIRALMAANQTMCKHLNKVSYSDVRDGGGWNCSACGASK